MKPVPEVQSMVETNAHSHLKSQYWNRKATKAIHSKIRQHFFTERFQTRAM